MRSLDEVKELILRQINCMNDSDTPHSLGFYQGYIQALRWAFEEELADWDPDKEAKVR